MPTPWPSTTTNGDTGAYLCRTVRDLLTPKLRAQPVADRMPRRERCNLLLAGERAHAGVNLRLLAEPDPDPKARPSIDHDPESARRTVTKSWLLQIVTKTDSKGGGAPSLGAVHEAVRDVLLASRAELTAAGVYAMREVPSSAEKVEQAFSGSGAQATATEAKRDLIVQKILTLKVMTVSFLDPE